MKKERTILVTALLSSAICLGACSGAKKEPTGQLLWVLNYSTDVVFIRLENLVSYANLQIWPGFQP